MERARQLIAPYLNQEGVIGIYVVGSSTRPHRDLLSDYDFEIIVEDEVYDRTPMAERQVFVFKPEDAQVVDYEFYLIPWRDFVDLAESTLDVFHFPYQHAIILHDPQGRLEPVIQKLAELPELLRIERMTVHFLELVYRLGRARKTAARGEFPINVGLLHGDALNCLVKLIFLAKRSWPSTKHWSEQELAELSVPEYLLEAATTWLSAPSVEHARALVGAVRAFLDDCGETFHRDMSGIQQWLFFTRQGKAAFERWGAR